MYIKIKHIPFSYIYKEFDIFFLEKYKIKKIKNINLSFEYYYNKIKIVNKITFLMKKLFINLKLLKYKKINSRLYFFKKYYRTFIDQQSKLI